MFLDWNGPYARKTSEVCASWSPPDWISWAWEEFFCLAVGFGWYGYGYRCRCKCRYGYGVTAMMLVISVGNGMGSTKGPCVTMIGERMLGKLHGLMGNISASKLHEELGFTSRTKRVWIRTVLLVSGKGELVCSSDGIFGLVNQLCLTSTNARFFRFLFFLSKTPHQ